MQELSILELQRLVSTDVGIETQSPSVFWKSQKTEERSESLNINGRKARC